MAAMVTYVYRPKNNRRILDEQEFRELLSLLNDQTSPIKTACNGALTSTNKVGRLEINQLNHQKNRDQSYSFPRLFLTRTNTDNTNGYQFEAFVLQPSLFHRNNVPPTVYFTAKLNDHSKPSVGLPKSMQRFFRWKISSITPNSIRNCISFMKFETIRPSNLTDNSYLGSWCKHMSIAEFGQLEEWRKVNHYPGSFHMGRKDKLWLRLRQALQKKHDKFDSFHPMTFVLPRDYLELDEYWKNSPSKLFIMKPPASARGNGIQVINHISQIPDCALQLPQSVDGAPTKKSTIIVQQYISNPLLLENGQKFDLRIYVLVTSVDPLRIYVYEEGLVRFASSKYTSQEDGIIDQYMHLTNYFVNKNNHEYQINNDCDSLHGCKWTLKRFWRYLEEHYSGKVNTLKLWDDILDIIIKTIICCEGPMNRLSHQNCKNDYTSYELFGFDIILDDLFKPWILEVNITPSLKSESNLDTSVKFRVIRDMFNIVGYNLPPPTLDDQKRLGPLAEYHLFFDRRLYTENLTKRDKAKQLKYQKLYKLENDLRKSSMTIAEETLRIDTNDERRVNESPIRLQNDMSCATESNSKTDLPKCDDENGNQQRLGVPSADQASDDDSSSCSKLISPDSILTNLTQSDIRVLMLSEDELSRCGQFKRVFPAATSSRYLRYFDKPRYYNLLLDAWEKRYKDNRMEGIDRLANLATFLD